MVKKTISKNPGALILILAVIPLLPAYAGNYIDVDFGVVYSDISSSETTSADGNLDGGDTGIHLGVGAYRNKDDSRWVYGVKLELDDVAGNLLLSVRALDLGYKISPRFMVNGFIGAARWDLATAAFGIRFGVGAKYRFGEHWALGSDISYSDSVARDKLLPGDDGGMGGPDIFFDIAQISLYVKYMF